MSRLSHREFERVLAFTRRLHACHHLAALQRLIVRGVSGLIGAERVAFEHFAPVLPQLWAVTEPDEPFQPWMWETLLAHLDEHPTINHFRRTGDPEAVKISDFVTTRQWHRTHLYQRLYRALGFEDQMGICIDSCHRDFFRVVLSRRRRNFSERDRALLNLLRPHIALAHANARAFERLRRGYQEQIKIANRLQKTAVVLDGSGRVRHCPSLARRWLRKYFGQPFQRHQLPSEFDSWLRGQVSSDTNRSAKRPSPAPLVRDQDGHRVVFRLNSGDHDGFLVVAEEQPVPNSAEVKNLGLTLQQARILQEVEIGRTNSEIAASLYISPHTVRTHLDNIFAALHVKNRTAAVARIRQLI